MRCEQPFVLREAWHVLVHLWPSPVVARVTSGVPGVDPGDDARTHRKLSRAQAQRFDRATFASAFADLLGRLGVAGAVGASARSG